MPVVLKLPAPLPKKALLNPVVLERPDLAPKNELSLAAFDNPDSKPKNELFRVVVVA